MEVILKHFPDLSDEQKQQFEDLSALYKDWNAKINVISRKDLDHFYTRHVLHSLSILKLNVIKAEEHVMDVGTGGGFPGIPLAICYPNTKFTLVDSIGKKIRVVQAVADALGLKNVTAIHSRMEDLDIQADHIVSRAVAPAIKLVNFTRSKMNSGADHIFIKGGDLFEEESEILSQFPQAKWEEHSLADWFEDEFFETKKIVRLRGIT